MDLGSASPVLKQQKRVMKTLFGFEDNFLSRVNDPNQVICATDINVLSVAVTHRISNLTKTYH